MTRSDVSSPARFLHVTNGTCAADILGAAGIHGVVSIWADPLYDGPVPGNLTDDELLELRATFLAEPTASARADAIDDLRQWRRIIAGHEAYEELVLWFEHDLFDQLNLIQILSWIRTCLPITKAVSLVCIGSFPGHPGFKGLGELAPHEMASLLETRQQLNEEQYSIARLAWRAFREQTPEALDDLRRSGTAALPYLAPALTRFLQEYPWIADGLSRSERRLLALAAAGDIDLAGAFPLMHEGEVAYYITDRSIAALAESLSRTSPSLLTLTDASASNQPGLRGRLAITDTGRAVLAGHLDRIAACGVDRWLGGVHLQSDEWRWDDQRRRVTPGRQPE